MLNRLWAWLLDKLQQRCPHDSSHVVADLLEGDAVASGIMVRWCRVCGACCRVSVVNAGLARAGEWRRPRPLWRVPVWKP